ncbi:MAG: hypothetical protein AABZ30_10785 [Myxococcota bacterium]
MRFARALAAHLPGPPAVLAVLGSRGLAEALERLGFSVEEHPADDATGIVVAFCPGDAALDAAARLVRDAGLLVVVDRGVFGPRPEARTFALASRGFVEVRQARAGRARLTTGLRLRVL